MLCSYLTKNKQYSNGLIKWQPSSTEQSRSHEGTQQGDVTSCMMVLTKLAGAGQSLAVIAETHLEDSGSRTQRLDFCCSDANRDSFKQEAAALGTGVMSVLNKISEKA